MIINGLDYLEPKIGQWPEWTIWQYSSANNLDLDVFNGDLNDLKMFGKPPLQPPVIPLDTSMPIPPVAPPTSPINTPNLTPTEVVPLEIKQDNKVAGSSVLEELFNTIILWIQSKFS